MYLLMFIISFCLAADASILIVNPLLYRRSLEYVNESIGPVWGVLYGAVEPGDILQILIRKHK